MKRYKKILKTTTAGFEPTLPKGNCLAGNRLNHSATLSYTILPDRHLVSLSSIDTTKTFLKKRQWQDLNLRIQRIIDFKSIALDHSATLSYTLIYPICLLVQVSIWYLHALDTILLRYLSGFPPAFPFLFLPYPFAASSTLTCPFFSNLQ